MKTMWTRREVLAAAAVAPLKLPRKIRLGMSGFDGHTSEVLKHLPQLADVELAAISDEARTPNQNRTPKAAAGVRRYGTLRELLAGEKLDLVAICGRNDERAEAIVACARAGVHIVAEKPIALSRDELDRVKKAVSESGVKLTMLLPMRYEPVYLALKEIVASGRIGEVGQIHSQKSYQLGTRPEWMLQSKSFGGTIPYIGVHMVDLMRWTSGREIVEAFSYQARLPVAGSGEMENSTGSVFKLDNGGVAVLHMDYLRPKAAGSHGDDRLRLAGTRGIAEYQESTGVTLMTDSEKPHRIAELPPGRSLFLEFLEHVYMGKPASLSLEEIYRVSEIVLAARESAERGTPVRAKG
jgi:predicted dehydrogenase